MPGTAIRNEYAIQRSNVATLDELPFSLRLFLRAYRWRRIDPLPWTPLRKPLRQSRVALVSTAGMTEADQQPFEETARGGDYTYRVIRDDADVSAFRESHRSESFDHEGIRSDPNLAFPLDRLHELARDGVVGGANARHLSFMGSLTATGHLVKETAPAAAQLLVDDGVDAALLVPV